MSRIRELINSTATQIASGANSIENSTLTTTGRILIENNKALLPKKAIGDLVFNMAMIFDTVDSSVITSEVTATTDGTYVLFDAADNVDLRYCVVSYLSEKVA